MKTSIFYVSMLLALASCNVLEPVPKFLPGQNGAVVLQKAVYVSHTATELIFETEVIVLNSFYRGLDNDYLLEEDFQIKGSGAYATISFDFIEIDAPAQPSRIVLLIDQSGSYQEIDPHNTRSQAINKFVRDVAAPDKLLIGAYSRDGKLNADPVEFFTTDFANTSESESRYLFNLSERTGGSGSVRDAANLAMDKLVADMSPSRKELVLLVHNGDDGSSTATMEDLRSKALLNDITVHTVVLGEVADKNSFSQLSIQTNGLFAHCPTEKELVKVFSELERLINKEKGFYKIRIKVVPADASDLQPGAESTHEIEITDPLSHQSFAPLSINIKIP
jgi:hypothetical protein